MKLRSGSTVLPDGGLWLREAQLTLLGSSAADDASCSPRQWIVAPPLGAPHCSSKRSGLGHCYDCVTTRDLVIQQQREAAAASPSTEREMTVRAWLARSDRAAWKVLDAIRSQAVHHRNGPFFSAPTSAGYRCVVILSDRTLREQLDAGRIVIDPLDETLIQPSSIDVRISNLFRVFRNHTRGVIDVKQDLTDLTELIEMPTSLDGNDTAAFMLHPGEFVLGSTLERVGVPGDLVGRVEGKSSLGRLGLMIHSTAGFIDAGFDGHITLELANVASLPITLYPGMKIGQISFMEMTSPTDKPYGQGATGSKYQGQRGPTPSRYFENFT